MVVCREVLLFIPAVCNKICFILNADTASYLRKEQSPRLFRFTAVFMNIVDVCVPWAIMILAECLRALISQGSELRAEYWELMM